MVEEEIGCVGLKLDHRIKLRENYLNIQPNFSPNVNNQVENDNTLCESRFIDLAENAVFFQLLDFVFESIWIPFPPWCQFHRTILLFDLEAV